MSRIIMSLENDFEGRVLASVDMEEIVKMTITDDIEKSNFNPQMLKSCTDTSYQCGYEQGRGDVINAIKNDLHKSLTEEMNNPYQDQSMCQGLYYAIQRCDWYLKDDKEQKNG